VLIVGSRFLMIWRQLTKRSEGGDLLISVADIGSAMTQVCALKVLG
jgi:hypothetical protein